MRIPSRSECLELMEAVELPQNIRRHSILVADAACRLARLASRKHPRLNLPLVEAGGLLHDIAKGICLAQKCNHASVGAALVRQWGFHAVAPIVEQHISLTEEDIRGPVTESLIVNYADKRVRHDQYVTLEERFEDLIDRYGRTSAQKDLLRQRLCLYRELERAIFRDLPAEPDCLFTTLPEAFEAACGPPSFDHRNRSPKTSS
jgi:putative nucleotidyltransferase with HDIG domain